LGLPIVNGPPAAAWICVSRVAIWPANSADSRASSSRSTLMPARSISRPRLRAGDRRSRTPASRLSRQPRLQLAPQPQRDVSVLGGIFGRLLQRHAVEGDLRLAGAAHRLEADRLVAEMDLAEVVHAMPAQAGVEVVAQQHGVVGRSHVDAHAAQHDEIIFEVLADLQHRGVAEQRPQPIEHQLAVELLRRSDSSPSPTCAIGM
jgi:hypothetical protein